MSVITRVELFNILRNGIELYTLSDIFYLDSKLTPPNKNSDILKGTSGALIIISVSRY